MPGVDLLLTILAYMAITFIFIAGLATLFIILVFIYDVLQRKHAILHNYPVLGHLRYLFEHVGKFFRQYFFTMDREELPFNRAERSWVYRAAKGFDNLQAFGSTRDLRPTGTILFANCPFPVLGQDAVAPGVVTIGPYCRQPYTTNSIFNISAMSYGSISKPAVQALSRGAALAGCWLNTGEGGLSRYHLEGNADLVFQIGTAKYGVRDDRGQLSDDRLRNVAAHDQVRMFEVKLSQGAKPGKGGILPGIKVTEEIADIRGIPAGHDSISPNRFPEIDNIEQLLDFIGHLRDVTGKPVGFKSVIGSFGWLEKLCREIHARGIESAPDFITIDSADGGSGAAPASLMDYMGLPIRESLPLVIDILDDANLKERIKVIASGKLITPAEVAWALCVGADFVTSARGFMFSLGCIQAMTCNKNTCPTGITTHNPRLQKGLNVEEKSGRVCAYAQAITHAVGVIAHSCGVREPRQLQRHHARMVLTNGASKSLAEL